jgi:hypothetical protein
MGFFDDLAMGLGFKERTQDYDARTARTIAAQDAYKSSGGSEAQRMQAAQRARSNFSYDTAGGNARIFLDRVGAKGGYDPGAYRPAVIQDDRPFTQRLFTSPQGPASPNPFAIGPASFSKPLPMMPGLLGILGYASGLLGPREPGTVSAPEGPMRVRPTGYTPPPAQVAPNIALQRFETPDARAIRAAQAARYYTGAAPVAGMTDDMMGLPSGPVTTTSLLEDYDYLMDPDMPVAVGLAPSASDTPETPVGADVTFEEFMDLQRQMEATYGLPELSAEQYLKNYERQYGG